MTVDATQWRATRYNFRTGQMVSTDMEVVGNPTTVWDYEGYSSMDLTVKVDNLDDLSDEFEPFKYGISLHVDKGLLGTTPDHVGVITKSQIDIETGTVRLGIGSVLDYLDNVYIYPYAPVSDSEAAFVIPQGTTEVEAARRIIAFPWNEGKSPNSNDPAAPDGITVSTLSNSSAHVLTEDFHVYYSDGMSVKSALEELKGIYQGIEVREVITGGFTTSPGNMTLEVYNRFGDNRTHLPTLDLSAANEDLYLSYTIDEEPYTVSRVIAVSRDSDSEENISSDLQHRVKTGETLLFDTFESLTDEATTSEMNAVLSSRLDREKYNASIYEISIHGRGTETLGSLIRKTYTLEDYKGAIINGTGIPRLDGLSKARIIGITHELGTDKYDLEVITDWSVLVYPQPTRKEKKEEAEKRKKKNKQKGQKPRKGNTPDWGSYDPPGGKWGQDLTPTFPDYPDPDPDPDPTPDPGGGGGGGQIPDPDGQLPLPDPNDTLGEGYKAEGDTIWRITEKKGLSSVNVPGHQNSIMNRNGYTPFYFSDINEKGEIFVPVFMNGAIQEAAPSNSRLNRTWHGSVGEYSSSFARVQTFAPVDGALHYDWTDLNIGPFSIVKYNPEDGELGTPEIVHEGINITGETMEMLGPWKPAETLHYNGGVMNARDAGLTVGELVVVGQTVFIPIVHSVKFPDSDASGFSEMKFLVIDKNGDMSRGKPHFFGGLRWTSRSNSQPFPYPPEGATVLIPQNAITFNPWVHRQALGGYKTVKLNTVNDAWGQDHYLIDMFSGATRHFSKIKNGELGVRVNNSIPTTLPWGYDRGTLPQPILIQNASGGLSYAAVGNDYSPSSRRIISADINSKSPIPSPPWTLNRSYSMDGGADIDPFQIRGNLFFSAEGTGATNYGGFYYYDIKNNFVSKLYDGVGKIEWVRTYTFSKGDWLYGFAASGGTRSSYKIEPYSAGSLYPERGGGDQDDLFVFYDFDMLQIKTPDRMMAPEADRYTLRVYQDDGSEMSTDKYSPQESRAFRFKENGFTEDAETFVEWQVWASNQKYNRDEDGNSAPAYSVVVSLTPSADEGIETSGNPTIVDNYKGGDGWSTPLD